MNTTFQGQYDFSGTIRINSMKKWTFMSIKIFLQNWLCFDFFCGQEPEFHKIDETTALSAVYHGKNSMDYYS